MFGVFEFMNYIVRYLLIHITLVAQINSLSSLQKSYQLISDNILLDSHNDLPEKISDLYDGKINGLDLRHLNGTHTDFTRMKKGGVKVQIWSAYVACADYNVWNNAVPDTLNQIDLIYRMIESSPETRLAKSTKDIYDIVKSGQIASLIGLEGGHSIGDSVGILRMMYELGARYMTLTHTCHTSWADSCAKPEIHGGLSQIGKYGILEMNRLGMMIDLSHVSHKVMKQVLEISKTPVIFSHSSSFALCNNPRNVPDDILEIIKVKDGVVMINFYPEFITCAPTATLNDVANHIDHIGNIAGRNHVGFGSDFDGINSVPIGLEDVSKYPYLISEMISRGWNDSEISGLMGENFLRVFKKIESYPLKSFPLESRVKTPKSCPKSLFLQL